MELQALILRPSGVRQADPLLVQWAELSDLDGLPLAAADLPKVEDPDLVAELGGGDWRWGRLAWQERGAGTLGRLPYGPQWVDALVRLTEAELVVRYLPGLRDGRQWTGAILRPATLQAWRAIRRRRPELPELATVEDLQAWIQE